MFRRNKPIFDAGHHIFLATFFALVLLICGSKGKAQYPLPLLADAPVALVPARVLSQFPVKTFLENIVVDAQGTIFVTSLDEGIVYRLRPNGSRRPFAHIAGRAAGLALDGSGGLLVGGWAADKTPTIWRVTCSGHVAPLLALPHAMFLNGFAALGKERYLIADSYLGAIWELNARRGKAMLWMKNPLLARSDPKNGTPAVNGLKVWGGTLYVSNTQRHLLLKIPLTRGGQPASRPQIFLKDINLDDFAFDTQGSLYATTHIYNTVVRISRRGKVTTVATARQGTVGSTSAAFERAPGERASLYITTNGGMSLPPVGGIQPARVVRLDIGVEGAR